MKLRLEHADQSAVLFLERLRFHDMNSRFPTSVVCSQCSQLPDYQEQSVKVITVFENGCYSCIVSWDAPKVYA